jgi:hypothetical protein
MNFVKEYFLDRGTKKLPEFNTGRTSVLYQQARTIGILFSTKNLEDPQVFNDFLRRMTMDGKIVKLLTYQDKDITNSNFSFNHHVISEKDISTFGEVSSVQVEEFLTTEFDYLICIDTKPFPVFENILKRSKAKCRVGKYYEGRKQHPYELMINIPEGQGTNALIKEIEHYIKAIRP